MKKVKGAVDFQVFADCPECGCNIDLIKFESEEMEISKMLFGNGIKPSKWYQMGVICKCPHCKNKFILDECEY